MREAVFIQAKLPSASEELAILLHRWNGYGRELSRNFGQDSIKIFSPTQICRSESTYKHLTFSSKTSNYFKNLVEASNVIKSSSHSVTLVCGDIQLSLLFALLLKMHLRKKIAIQTQFHGDIYSQRNNPGFKGLIRTLFSRLAIQHSDSIRIVSKFQESEIRNLASHCRADFVVAPIPIDFSKIPNSTEFTEVFDVALIGRLHVERGVREAVSIIRELVLIQPSIKIMIVGEGPERKLIEFNLKSEIASGCVNLAGALYGPGMRGIYAKSKILLSSAPSEGYGLTLREAALSGMLVVARSSLGAEEAAKDFPARFHFYNSKNMAVTEILKALKADSRLEDNSALIEFQENADEKGLGRLLASWVRS
jgi:glycosyltransferase involved in cell wall biosynthesis